MASVSELRLRVRSCAIREEILLLDEPTSALDTATEAAILATLRRLACGRTVIIATHRLKAAMIADRIAVFDAGRVVEYGTHADLVATGEIYRKLWKTQGHTESTLPALLPTAIASSWS